MHSGSRLVVGLVQQQQNHHQLHLFDDRLSLHPSNGSSSSLILGTRVENYQHYSQSIMDCLLVKIKISFIDGSCTQ